MTTVPEKVLNWLYSVLTSVITPVCFLGVSGRTDSLFVGIRRCAAHLLRRSRGPLELSFYFPANRSLQYAFSSVEPHYIAWEQKGLIESAAYENGSSALLLLLSGTLPVTFRGTVYRFPVALWVPYAYPHESPIVYVTPSQDMIVRPGQHVGGDGRVYHPYLAQWGKYWDVSDFQITWIRRSALHSESLDLLTTAWPLRFVCSTC